MKKPCARSKHTFPARCHLAASILAALAASAQADVTSSGLGTAVSAGPNFDISGGTHAGSNLFHSFGDFSLTSAQSATFQNAANASNIIGRITGGKVSDIDGAINSPSPANLYLINPEGMVFGPNANLNVNGSFHASTADYLSFQNGEKFYADANNTNSVLSTAAPVSFGFLGSSAAPIAINGSQLTATQGNGLEFSGGDVTIQNNAQLDTEEGGSIQLDAQGTLTLTSTAGGGSSLTTFPKEAPGAQGGNIEIRARDVKVENGGEILALTSGIGHAGNISITAGGRVLVSGVSPDEQNVSLIASAAESGSTGQAGAVTIQAQNLTVENGGEIHTATHGAGNAGSVFIKADGTVLVSGVSPDGQDIALIASSAEAGSTGLGGTVTIQTQNLTVEKGGEIHAATYGPGKAGDVSITASGMVRVNGVSPDGQLISLVTSSAEPGSSGNGGVVTIEAHDVVVEDGGEIHVATHGAGDAGSVSIKADGTVRVSGVSPNGQNISLIASSAEPDSSGHGGTIMIEAQDLTVENGGEINTATYGAGDAGSVSIKADGTVRVSGVSPDGQNISLIASSAEAGSTGHGGNTTIEAQDLTVENGGEIFAATHGSGDAGDVRINANHVLLNKSASLEQPSAISTSTTGEGTAGTIYIGGKDSLLADDVILRNQGQISSSAWGDATGNGGSIILFANLLNLDNGSAIAATSESASDAGSITINGTQWKGQEINLSGNSRITVESASGNAGNIRIYANKWLYMLDSQMSTSAAAGLGNGGNILIDPQFVILNNSQIIANALQGNGGNIDIITQFFLASTDSLISASSQFGLQGTVSIQSAQSNIAGSISVLPGVFMDVSGLIREGCGRSGQSSSTFTSSSMQGLVLNSPDNALDYVPASLEGCAATL